MVPSPKSESGSAVESFEFAASAMLFGAGMGALDSIVYFASSHWFGSQDIVDSLAGSISGAATGLAYSVLRIAARRLFMRGLDGRNEPTTTGLWFAIAEAVVVGTIWGCLSAIAGEMGIIAYSMVVSGTIRVRDYHSFLFAGIAVLLSWPVPLGTFLLLRQSVATKSLSSGFPPAIGLLVGLLSVPVANYCVGWGALYYFAYLA